MIFEPPLSETGPMMAETPRARIAADRITMGCGLLSSLRLTGVAASFAAALLTGVVGAQTSDSAKRADVPAFFQSQDPIEVTFTTNIGKIREDKRENPPWRPATLTYRGTEGN